MPSLTETVDQTDSVPSAQKDAAAATTIPTQMALYVFFRESGFYPLELRDDNDARANAELNPGTIRVLKMPTEEQVWPLN